jgi:hypothetical protein
MTDFWVFGKSQENDLQYCNFDTSLNTKKVPVWVKISHWIKSHVASYTGVLFVIVVLHWMHKYTKCSK